MNKWTVIIISILSAFPCTISAKDHVDRYIKKHKALTLEKMKGYGIPASLILGVAILESEAGKSPVCRAFHNHFGIVGKNSGPSKIGYVSKYREYKSDSASFDDFCKVLKKKHWYTNMYNNKDYHKWLVHMISSGYSSMKGKWIRAIVSIIHKYNLVKLDNI
jgi:Bax protein